jgi:hypothetical protein
METSSGTAAESGGRIRANGKTNRAYALTGTNTNGGAAHRCGSGTHRQMGGVADHLLAAR